MAVLIHQRIFHLIFLLPLVNKILSVPQMNQEDQMTQLEDPVQIYIAEHPNSTVPPWRHLDYQDLDPTVLQSDLAQVKDDLVTRIADLKQDGAKLRTSIEGSNGETLTLISTLKTQVFQKIHEMQHQVSFCI